jgi:hypothetical protein
MSKTRFETADYYIDVGSDPAGDGDYVSYTIVNKEYGVIEYVDNILPRTLDTLSNFQEKLDEATAALVDKERGENVVSITQGTSNETKTH